ncbi:Hypothetical predicted protein [Podarcis lilfordi]|uniref:Uncharacterized protein n=1 Tax=Podarcis lilfordi TaxID=74358 RepID=A0AA35PS13_9SAUR|nr:Hypothetical predicted protein [Podarcis lilfordi]
MRPATLPVPGLGPPPPSDWPRSRLRSGRLSQSHAGLRAPALPPEADATICYWWRVLPYT